MDHIQGNNRNQIRMLSLDQMVEPESMVRIIDAFVDMLDLKQFDFNYFSLNKEGRPPYHPAIMMKLYLYGYQNSIRTCRKVKKACKTNIEVMWLVGEQRPHFKTIAIIRVMIHTPVLQNKSCGPMVDGTLCGKGTTE